MPIYEYACGDCGNAFEALVRSDTTPECPTCHSTKLDKLLSKRGVKSRSRSALSQKGLIDATFKRKLSVLAPLPLTACNRV
ncbi:MAG: zinc ribbon domain-containing protein [Comamonadaceae bacterium]